MTSRILIISLLVLRRLGGATAGGASPASDSLYPCEYFLQTPLDPTSCHDQAVPEVMPLVLHGPLKAQMVKSVTRQVVQMGTLHGHDWNWV